MDQIDKPRSSHISGLAYDASQRKLFVEFKGTRLYEYRDVPDWVWVEMKGAPSKGRYLNEVIKPGFAYSPLKGLLNRDKGQLEFSWAND
jgi:hypothetical protein